MSYSSQEVILSLVYSIKNKKNYLLKIPNVHMKINLMFDMLKLKKEINQKFMKYFFLMTGEKIYNLDVRDYPKEFPKIRGPAEYYKYGDLYIIFCTGNPYIFIYKYKKY